MTLADLKTLVAYWLDDVNYEYFSEAQITVWLNNAQKEVQKLLLQAKVNHYVTPVQTTLVVNQNDYVLPSDFMGVNRLEVVNSGTPPTESVTPVAPITLNQKDLVSNQTGTPQWYFLKKNRIYLLPAPDTALTLRLYYSYLVSDMTLATDSPDIPVAYHEMLAVLATIDGFMKDGRNAQQMVAKRTYYETMLKQEAQDRTEDAPRSIVQTGNDITQMFGYF